MVNQSYVVENYPGIPDISGADLIKKIYDHTVNSGGIFVEDVMTGISKTGDVFSINTLNGAHCTAKAVIAATGKSPRLYGAKGETDFLGKVLRSLRPVTVRCTKIKWWGSSAEVTR